MNTSNVITAVVVGGRATAMSKRYMTDHGQYLKIIGLDLPEVYRVDFSNDEHKGEYVRMVGNADGVLVPSQYLASGLDVWAFPVLVTETAERTLATIRIININRPANNVDPQPEPEQESAIDRAIAELNTAVEKTAEDVIKTETNVSHYPKIIDGYWNVWDAKSGEYVNSGIKAKGDKGDKGDAYVLTQADKEEIVSIMLYEWKRQTDVTFLKIVEEGSHE